LTEPIDEWAINHLPKFENKYPFTDIAKEGVKLEGSEEEEEKERQKENEKEYKAVIQFLQDHLKGKISKVAISDHLVKTAAALSAGTFGYSANMERLMKAQALADNKQLAFMKSMRVLEINPYHPILKELKQRIENEGADNPTNRLLADLLYETGALHSGFSLDNPADFASRIHRLMKLALNINADAEAEEPEPIAKPSASFSSSTTEPEEEELTTEEVSFSSTKDEL
jgi:molecular chaperone HtpG